MAALRQAIQGRRPAPGTIHHSDRGVQYAAGDYVKELKEHGFRISMLRRGNPYDNAWAESFMSTLKRECVLLWEYRDIGDVLARVPQFIEDVYNTKRLHSALGYLPPAEFEAPYQAQAAGPAINSPVHRRGTTPVRLIHLLRKHEGLLDRRQAFETCR